MLDREDILNYLRERKSDFEKEFNITKVGLFGSYARNEQREDIDIDLIVEFAPNTQNLISKETSLS